MTTPWRLHIDATLKNRRAINLLLEDLKKVTLSEKEQQLTTKFSETRERFSKDGINIARGLLKEGKFLEANELLLLKSTRSMLKCAVMARR